MANVKIEAELAASPAAVWEIVRDFGDVVRWSPGITSCELDGAGVGAVRTIKLGDIVIRERLEAFDDVGRSFSYSIVEAPLPLQNYLATFAVAAAADGSKITWSSTFAHEGIPAADAQAMVEGIYRSGIKGIEKALATE